MFFDLQGVLSGVLAVMNWFTDICMWKSPVTTVLVYILFLILIWYPELLLPTVFLYMFLIGAWNYRFRSRTPPFMDAKLSQGEYIGHLDELEEEFNVVPANRAQEVMQIRTFILSPSLQNLHCTLTLISHESVLMEFGTTVLQILKFRYERLRGVSGRIQNALGDLASMGEKLQSLLSWRDPRYVCGRAISWGVYFYFYFSGFW